MITLFARHNALLTAGGVFFLLCVIPSALAFALDTRLFNGISVWIKPMKFQISLAVHLLTVALLLRFLAPELRRGRVMVWLAAAILGTALFEAAYITLQAARGTGSHYNLSTPVTAFLYTAMGVGAVILVAATAWVGVLILRAPHGPAVLAQGAGLGLLLGGVLGGITGIWMGGAPGHWVGGTASDAGGLPILGWSRDGGDLRVAHFFGLHLMQALPLLAFGLWRAGVRRWRVPLYAGAAVGVAVTVVTLAQAVAGRPFP